MLEFEKSPSLAEIKTAYEKKKRKENKDGSYFSTTLSQQQLYFYEVMNPNTNLYCIPMIYQINQKVDINLLERAFQKLLERHSAFRITFENISENVKQKVHEMSDFNLPIIDFSIFPEEQRNEKINTQIREEVEKGFSFSGEKLFRCMLFKYSEEKYYLIINVHHIIFDGVSQGIMFRDLSEFYTALKNEVSPSLPKLEFGFAEYAENLNQRIENGSIHNAQEYWMNEVEDGISYLDIKPDYIREKKQNYTGSTIKLDFDYEVSEKIKKVCSMEHTTMHIFFLSVLAAMLYRYTSQENFAIWTPLSRRMEEGLEGQIGYYTDMYPIQFNIKENSSFQELLSFTQDKCLMALDNQIYPFSNVELDYALENNGLRLPDIQVSFEYTKKENFYLGDSLLKPVSFEYDKVKYDLDISIIDDDGEIAVCLDYRECLYKQEAMGAFIKTYYQMVKSILTELNSSLEQLLMVSDKERKDKTFVLSGLKDRSIAFENVFRMFEYVSLSHTDKTAVICDNEQISYGELNQRANQYANWILCQNICKEEPITVLLDKSIQAIAVFIGIVKAGCAYMPLNEEWSNQQIEQMMKSANSIMVITQDKYKEKFSRSQTSLLITVNSNEVNQQPDSNTSIEVGRDNLLNILHTSGTTGIPKGVALTHKGVLRLLGKTEYLKFTEDDVVLQLSGLDYDGATMEIWGTLCHGGTLVLMQKEEILDMDLLAESIERNKATIGIFSTQLFNRMVDSHINALARLKQIECGGEVISIEHVKKALEYCRNSSIINGYGPTENTFVSTFYRIEKIEPKCASIPIGRPVTNTDVYVLDRNLNPVPDYMPGELFLGGDGVARGYLNADEANQNSYVKNPYLEDSTILYRTGDIVRKLPNGNLEFINRRDGQIKIRGHRIETEAVKGIIIEQNEIEDCYIDYDNKSLCTYMKAKQNITEEQKEQVIKKIRQKIMTVLSQYAVPDCFIYIDEIPLNRSGKVNVKRLREQYVVRKKAIKETEQTETEQKLRKIWEGVLNHSEFYNTDHFFEIGGHSLLLFEVLKKIKEEFNIIIPITELFIYTTIQQLAQRVDGMTAKEDKNSKYHFKKKNVGKSSKPSTSDVAVIGMGLRFPKADNPLEFWNNIFAGRNCISKLTEEEIDQLNDNIDRRKLIPYGGYIDNEFQFDPELFGISEAEALMMEPQQRILLMCVWEAIEDAGYSIDKISHEIAVYIAGEKNGYFADKKNRTVADAFHAEIGSSPEFLPLKISYNLDLNGESILVNTGCSSSLVAVHLACQSLIQGNCEYAVAGGVSLRIPQRTGYQYEEGFIMSPDGQCAPFDKDGKGTVEGNGAGIVLLKRLEDAMHDQDPIYAVIKGSYVNNDGKDKIGFTAPGQKAQVSVIEKAIEKSGVSKEEIGLIEAHGTGTKLGDQIEISGLKEVFKQCENKHNSIAVGSVKSNIGHLNMAAGIAGFIKACLAVYYKKLPPTIQ